jgi:hypothetical protein
MLTEILFAGALGFWAFSAIIQTTPNRRAMTRFRIFPLLFGNRPEFPKLWLQTVDYMSRRWGKMCGFGRERENSRRPQRAD